MKIGIFFKKNLTAIGQSNGAILYSEVLWNCSHAKSHHDFGKSLGKKEGTKINALLCAIRCLSNVNHKGIIAFGTITNQWELLDKVGWPYKFAWSWWTLSLISIYLFMMKNEATYEPYESLLQPSSKRGID